MPEFYIITLSAAETDIIGTALGELPMRIALPLWSKLKTQVEAAQAAATAEQAIAKESTDVSDDTVNNTAS